MVVFGPAEQSAEGVRGEVVEGGEFDRGWVTLGDEVEARFEADVVVGVVHSKK